MPGGVAKDGSGSKWTRMWWSDDMSHMNVRREHLAHVVHYKVDVHEMKEMAKTLGRPLRILNVGCGEANEVRMFYAADQTEKKKVIKEYVGLEGDPACVARTQERAATVLRGINGRIEVCDITKGEFPVKPASVDLVICNEVLEHIPQDKVRVVLRAIHRAMRREGLAIISTPNKDGTNDKLPADHVYEWGYQELQDAFTAAKLEVIDELGVYIKLANLKRYLRETEGSDSANLKWAEDCWNRYGLDLGSIMTADLARPVANNVIWKLVKA